MTSDRPRILYVCSHCPAGPDYGARLRTRHIGRLLQRFGEVTLLLASVGQWSEEQIRATRDEFDTAAILRFRQVGLPSLRDRLRRELDPAFLNTEGQILDGADRALARRLANEHDLVWIHTLRTANAVGLERWPRAVLDVDDVPSQFFETEAARAPGPIARWRLRMRAGQWRRREALAASRFDALCVCSARDRDRFSDGRVEVIPNGFEIDRAPERRPTDPPRFGFIGTLRYEPNRAGVEWLAREVWPRVRSALPGAVLRLAGEGTERAALSHPGVEALGYVPDAGAEIATWSAMLVPILTGGGTRIKVAEAFGRRCPVVSTALGAFGYDVRDGRELLIADSAEAFAAACVRVARDEGLAQSLTAAASAYYDAHCTWSASASIVQSLVRDIAAAPTNQTVAEPVA